MDTARTGRHGNGHFLHGEVEIEAGLLKDDPNVLADLGVLMDVVAGDAPRRKSAKVWWSGWK